jgi:hypothetical protein
MDAREGMNREEGLAIGVMGKEGNFGGGLSSGLGSSTDLDG